MTKKLSKTAESILRGLKQAVAYMDGTGDKSTYRVHVFRNEVDKRLASLDQDKGIPGDKAIAELRKKSKKRREQAKKELKLN